MTQKQKDKLKLWLLMHPILVANYFTETEDSITLDIDEIRSEFEKELSELIELVNEKNK